MPTISTQVQPKTATTLEKLLADLVAMPTYSTDSAANHQALDYIQDYLTQRGMHCQRWLNGEYGMLLASTRADNTLSARVQLAGHLDVVTAKPNQLKLRKQGGKLFGRGVYDMKWAIAGYMQLVDEIKNNLEAYDFSILVTTDEEFGGTKGANCTVYALAKGCKPAVCILPDSTAPGWDVEESVKGLWRFVLTAKGLPAHSSRPWEGDSATARLVQALQEINQHFADQSYHTDTVNIGTVQGGTAFNEVAEHAEAKVEIRQRDFGSIAANQAYIADLCKRHQLSVETAAKSEPHRHDLSNPEFQTFMHSVQDVTGRLPQGFASLGSSDAKHYANRHIPCILTCPVGGGHHSDTEWVDRASLA